MKEYYDDKGKLFTDVVTKRALTVILYTPDHTIQGEIHLLPDDRLIDDLNHPEKFLAVTHAAVYSHAGELLYQTAFLSINRDHIVWVAPGGEVTQRPVQFPEVER
jgi:hypothetical protein